MGDTAIWKGFCYRKVDFTFAVSRLLCQALGEIRVVLQWCAVVWGEDHSVQWNICAVLSWLLVGMGYGSYLGYY